MLSASSSWHLNIPDISSEDAANMLQSHRPIVRERTVDSCGKMLVLQPFKTMSLSRAPRITRAILLQDGVRQDEENSGS